jgi:hypothetical protein
MESSLPYGTYADHGVGSLYEQSEKACFNACSHAGVASTQPPKGTGIRVGSNLNSQKHAKHALKGLNTKSKDILRLKDSRRRACTLHQTTWASLT